MKRRLLLVITVLAGISCITWALRAQTKPTIKTYRVEMSLEEWATKINHLEYIKNKLKISDLPSKETTLITDSILTPFQSQISNQVNQQLAAEKPKPEVKKDSTKLKK